MMSVTMVKKILLLLTFLTCVMTIMMMVWTHHTVLSAFKRSENLLYNATSSYFTTTAEPTTTSLIPSNSSQSVSQMDNVDVFRNLQQYAMSLANSSTTLFKIVSESLRGKWSHKQSNAKYLKRQFDTRYGNVGVYDQLMLSKENAKVGIKLPLVHEKNEIRISSGDYRFFPKSNTIPRPPYKSCSVIGSSGILQGSRCGRTIDSSDFVFRFNLAPTDGYVDDVGAKINMTTMNLSILKRLYSNLNTSKARSRFKKVVEKQNGHIWSPAYGFTSSNGLPVLVKINKIIESAKHINLVVADPRSVISVSELWKNYGLARRPSTGFYFISVALALCDNVQVFGFWPFNMTADAKPVAYHYYDEIWLTKVHDMSFEFKLILAMHQQGLLRIRIDHCDEDGDTN